MLHSYLTTLAYPLFSLCFLSKTANAQSRGKCLPIRSKLFNTAEYISKHGKSFPKNTRMFSRLTTVNFGCQGGDQVMTIQPANATCMCTKKNMCDWKYKFDGKVKNWRREPGRCVFKSCNAMPEENSGGTPPKCDAFMEQGARDKGRYLEETNCFPNCEGATVSVGSDLAKCDCKINGLPQRTIKSACGWQYHDYGNTKESTVFSKTDTFFCSQASCKPPTGFANGKDSCSGSDSVSKGDICTFSCYERYMLKKNTVGECACDEFGCGMKFTNGVDFPECIYDVNYAPLCPVLMIQPLNGFVDCGDGVTSNQARSGAVCQFKCNPGYERSFRSGASCHCADEVNSETCQWKLDAVPDCVKVNPCKKEPCGPNGKCRDFDDLTYQCECLGAYKYSSTKKTCVKPSCENFLDEQLFLLGSDFIEPECLFPKDTRVADNGTVIEENRTLIMPETSYDYEDGTTCHPRCGGGKHRLGKKQYKCTCKNNDADRCVWGGMRRNKIKKNAGKKTTECTLDVGEVQAEKAERKGEKADNREFESSFAEAYDQFRGVSFDSSANFVQKN